MATFEIELAYIYFRKLVQISNDVFDIVTEGRTYRMEDQDRTADKWVQAINQLARS